MGTVDRNIPAARKRAAASPRRSGRSRSASAMTNPSAKSHVPGGKRGARKLPASAGTAVHWPSREKDARSTSVAANRAGSAPGSTYNPEPLIPKPSVR
jgi:hypothetical protein